MTLMAMDSVERRGLLVSRYGIEARRIHATAYGIAYFSPLPAKNRVVVAHAGE